ncbi:MAG: SURF1 family protein, partial [Alphaproteobacteria bacterium]
LESAARAAVAEAVPLPARLDDPTTFDFVHVRLTGRLIHDKTLYLSSRTYRGRVGQHAVTPLVRRDGGGVVLVDRGWVPPDWRAPAQAGVGDDVVEGMARVFPEPGLFTLDNDAARNIWFIVSQEEMATAIDLGDVAPVFVTVSPGSDPGVVPIGETPGLNLPNNHLIYAITWYALALALLVIYAIHSSRRDEV